MKAISAVLGCVGLSMVLAAPSYAQTTKAPATTQTAAPVVATTQPNAEGPNGSLEKYHDMWRASKLVGASVYNENGQTIGSIDDLMIGNDGKIADAVVSVGGFLGIGGKLVSVPFEQFKFVESRKSTNAAATTTPALAPASGTAATTTPAAPPATTTGMAPATTTTTVAAGEPIYYSIVLPSATKQSLSSAAGFKYTS